jgi:predicted ester cyclase
VSTDENKAISRRFWEEVVTGRHVEIIDQLIAEDFVDHGGYPGQAPGLESARAYVSACHKGSSDVLYTVEDIFAEDDRVVVRWSVTGTHDGDYFGAPPTGRRVTGGGITIDRIANGRIVESWQEFDTLSLAQQLGVLAGSPA